MHSLPAPPEPKPLADEMLEEGAEVLVRWLTLVQRTGARNSVPPWCASPEQVQQSVGPDWTRAYVTGVEREVGSDRPMSLHIVYLEGDLKRALDTVPVAEVRRAVPPGAISGWPECHDVEAGCCMRWCPTGVPDLVRRVPTALLSHPLLRKV